MDQMLYKCPTAFNSFFFYKCSDAYILKPHVKKCPLVIEDGGKIYIKYFEGLLYASLKQMLRLCQVIR